MFAFKDEEVQTLTRLGLTFCQARVYLALVRSGIATAKTISKVSKVAREDVYRIMPMLQKLGLVEKAITSPSMFKAIPIQDGLSILLERRIEETSELQAKTKEVLQNLMEKNTKTTLQEEEPQFFLIPEKTPLFLKIRELADKAQTSIDIACTWQRVKSVVLDEGEYWTKIMEKGVKIRVITEKPQDENQLPEIVQFIKKNPSYKLRYILTPVPVVLMMYDKKQVIFCTSRTTDDPTRTPSIWSNNPSLLALAQTYFEKMWKKSLEKQIRRTLIVTSPS
jgi:sugar-specific transcriptional regulator TrmB